MRIVFSWDDGAPQDLKLMELHRKYEIPGMFFVPTENSEGRSVLTPTEIRENASELIAFGGHTQHHVYLPTIPFENVEKEITDNQAYLEDILGEKVEHFCLPGGKYNEEILQVVFEHFVTCRTADTMNFTHQDKLLVPTFHLYPRGIKSLVGNALRHNEPGAACHALVHFRTEYFQLLRLLLDQKAKEKDTEIILWGHSWELEQFGLWDQTEELMKYIKEAYGEHIVSYEELAKHI